MLKHDSKIKKLSEAIRLGLAIGKEQGIVPATGSLVNTDEEGKLCEACALGFGYIGRFGVKKATELVNDEKIGYEKLAKTFKIDKVNECFVKVAKKKGLHEAEGGNISDTVIRLNDNGYATPKVIANGLEKCGL